MIVIVLVYIVLLFICIYCAQTIRNALIKRNLERAKEEQLLKPFIEE